MVERRWGICQQHQPSDVFIAMTKVVAFGNVDWR